MAISDGGFILGTTQEVVDNGGGFYSEAVDDSAGDEDYTFENGQAIRVFYTLWSDRDVFIDNLLGYSSNVGGSLFRVTPDQHPDWKPLYATNATAKGAGIPGKDSAGSIGFQLAKITAIYQPLDYVVAGDGGAETSELDRYCTRSYSFSSQYLSLQGYMGWVSRTTAQVKTLNVPPGKIIGATELTIIWRQVPGPSTGQVPLEQTISTLAGCVNSQTFDDHYIGAVLFLGCDPHMIKPRLTANPLTSGFYQWDLAYKFLIVRDNPSSYPPVSGDTSAVAGHNYFWDVTYGRWDLVTASGGLGGQTVYQYGDLNQLFQIGNP